MKAGPVLFAAVLAVAGAAFGSATERTYEDRHFRLRLPEGAVSQDSKPIENELLREVYVADGLVWAIRLTETPAGYLASTAIEQALQAEMKAGAPLGEVRRWELYTRQQVLFKGISRLVPAETAVLGVAPQVDELRGETVLSQSLSMAPLSDESSPILTLAVAGPTARKDDVEKRAKELAFSFWRIQEPPRGPQRDTGTGDAKPSAPRPLKKGDIELSGTVASIAADRKSLVMTVNAVRMPGGKPIELNPPRSKRVFLRSFPDELTAGKPILVIGRNDGVGMPILADILELIPQNSGPQKKN